MTAVNIPRTLLDALARDMASIAHDGAIYAALSITDGCTPERRAGGQAAKRLLDLDFTAEARETITYLNSYFGLKLTGDEKRRDV